MSFRADRITGALIATFGGVLYLFIIPRFVDSSQSSWIRPDTIPLATSFVIVLCGAFLVFKPTAHSLQNLRGHFKAVLFFLLLALGLYAMSMFGFVYIAPLLALSLMLLIGERRLLWLGLGVIGVPFAIWLLVVRVLERSLP
ncbi:MAG: hypothetical protein GKR95_13570 [Gammaproteobacteria bacterium]|nr:hypothetical protein [Gammaproteobacteria bacterium]